VGIEAAGERVARLAASGERTNALEEAAVLQAQEQAPIGSAWETTRNNSQRAHIDPQKNDPFHALGRLNEAVHALATYPGSIRARLFEAMKSLTPISPKEIPDGDLRRVFIGVSDDLRHVEAQGNEGRLVATLRHTEDEDLSKIAGRILDLYQWLDELLLHRR
jgi:hypothetical protein